MTRYDSGCFVTHMCAADGPPTPSHDPIHRSWIVQFAALGTAQAAGATLVVRTAQAISRARMDGRKWIDIAGISDLRGGAGPSATGIAARAACPGSPGTPR